MNNISSFTVTLQHKGGHLQPNIIYKKPAKVTDVLELQIRSRMGTLVKKKDGNVGKMCLVT